MRLMSWNIKSGGFNSYDPSAVAPERSEKIKQVIDEYRNVSNPVTTVVLSDVYRWDEVYGEEPGIAAHLGYKEARFTRLGDKRLEANNGAGIGVALATDEKIATSRVLDLETRSALGIVLDIGKYGLQMACAYLDDLDENVRLRQVRALRHELEPDIPTILTGDFNTLRPELRGARPLHQVRDMAVRMASPFLPGYVGLFKSIKGMNERRVVPEIMAWGYRDADTAKRPTAPAYFPALGIDYIFYQGVEVKDVVVPDWQQIYKASDHLPLVANIAAEGHYR